MKDKKENLGFGLAEVMLASGVLILVVGSILALSRFVIRGYALTTSRMQALYLAQEGMEQVRNARDSRWIDANIATDFSNLVPSCPDSYHALWSGGQWQLQCGTEPAIVFGGQSYSRQILITPVTGVHPSLDPHMYHVRVVVTWQEGGRTNDVSAETYLANWKLET